MGSLIFILAFFGAVVVLIVGSAGRRVGDGPHCNACNFDLTGIFPERKVCPECGADLTGGPAVASGRLERRKGLLTLGVVVLILSTTLIILGARGSLSKSKLVKLLPTQVLIDQSVLKPQSMIAQEASVELCSRLTAGELDDQQQQTILDATETLLATNDFQDRRFALWLLMNLPEASNLDQTVLDNLGVLLIERYTDPTSRWNMNWSKLITTVHELKGISPEHWQAALIRGITPVARISAGATVPPGETFLYALNPNYRALEAGAYFDRVTIDLPEGFERIGQYGYGWEDDIWIGFLTHSQQPLLLVRAPMTPGVYTIKTIRTISAPPGRGPGTPAARTLANGTQLTHTLSVRVEDKSEPMVSVDRIAWLRRHMITANYQQSSWSIDDPVIRFQFMIYFGLTEPYFFAKGRLVAVAVDGTETVLNRFQSQFTSDSSLWSFTREKSDGQGAYSTPSGKRSGLPFVATESPLEYLRPTSTVRLVAIFDQITLPPPYTHEGPEPIRVELDRTDLPHLLTDY
jgi:hypothetical protein